MPVRFHPSAMFVYVVSGLVGGVFGGVEARRGKRGGCMVGCGSIWGSMMSRREEGAMDRSVPGDGWNSH